MSPKSSSASRGSARRTARDASLIASSSYLATATSVTSSAVALTEFCSGCAGITGCESTPRGSSMRIPTSSQPQTISAGTQQYSSSATTVPVTTTTAPPGKVYAADPQAVMRGVTL